MYTCVDYDIPLYLMNIVVVFFNLVSEKIKT